MSARTRWILISLIVLMGISVAVGAAILLGNGFAGLVITPRASKLSMSFAQARAEHTTKLHVSESYPSEPLPPIYDESLEHTSFVGPLGEMAAIATRVGEPGAMKPAVIWVSGGFGGISEGLDWFGEIENDQGIASFLDPGIVLFLPTFRGEHANPGVFECFYGEIDDLVAAVEHVAARPDVDPKRVYLMGHSTGGTKVLLASMLTDIPAGVVSFGAAPDMHSVAADGYGYGVEPYDMNDAVEVRLRSPIQYTKDIKVPVLYVEGEGSALYAQDAHRMQAIADTQGVDFSAAIINGGDHFSILRPIKDMLAKQILSGITMLPSPLEVQSAFDVFYADPEVQLFLNIQTIAVDELRRLLGQGADANARNASGRAALALAITANPDPQVAKELISAGADVNALEDFGGTPLIYASIYNPGYVQLLIEAGADINHSDDNGATSLMYAVSNAEDASIIRFMLDAGANVNAKDNDQFTVLMYAAANTSNPEFIAMLVDAGADIHARDNREHTPLMNAAMYNGSPRVLTELINAGADVNARTSQGITPLNYASIYTENPEIVQALLDAQADATIRDSEGNSALDYAKENEAILGTDALESLTEASQ